LRHPKIFLFKLELCLNRVEVKLKIAVISDIHSNLEAFQAVLNHMGKVDQILCIGDFVGYGAKPNEVIELIKHLKMTAVMGNHDYASLTNDTSGFNPYAAEAAHYTHQALSKESKSFLTRLPQVVEIEIKGYKFYLAHGSPRDPLNEYIFPGTDEKLLKEFLASTGADILLLGHTHIPLFVKIKKGLVLNPGGVGQPRDYDPRASYVIFTINNRKWSFKNYRVEYAVSKTASEILAAGLPSILAERLYYGQ